MTTRRLGAHVSVAGSLLRATEEATRIGANTIQIFSSSPRMWKASKLDLHDVRAFRTARDKLDIRPMAIHCSYLINLAAAEDEIFLKSAVGMRGEIERAIQLDADYVVAHPGSCKGQCAEDAIARLTVGMREAGRGLKSSELKFLWEITAGQGQALGSDIGQLKEIAARTAEVLEIPVGYCVDTAHCFAAGLDLFDVLRELGPENVPVSIPTTPKSPSALASTVMSISAKAILEMKPSAGISPIPTYATRPSFSKHLRMTTATTPKIYRHLSNYAGKAVQP